MPDYVIHDDPDLPTYSMKIMTRATKTGHVVSTNRFQLFSRLAQYYVVEAFSRGVDRQLQWQRNNQNYILGRPSNQVNELSEHVNEFGDTVQFTNQRSVVDQDREDNRSINATYLSESITGSPRHLKNLALDSLAIVSEYGKPTVFITLTFNERWPELEERLFPGQTAFDAFYIVDIIFKARLRAFIYNLKNGKYFGGRRTIYLMHVIEYQNRYIILYIFNICYTFHYYFILNMYIRGLPHAHIVARLDQVPHHEDPDACIQFIDQHITAQMPLSLADDDNEYYDIIKSVMLHRCFVGPGGCQKVPGGPCSRGYTDTDVRHATSFDEKGYPLYKRPLHEDLRVVPHCRDIVLDWKGHCNVEFAGSTYTVLYLYGYLFKGNKKLRVELGNTEDVDHQDEITLHLRGRMVTSNDAFWRIMGYDTYPAPDPSVMKIKVKTPIALQMEREKFKTCDLEVYFCRPHTAEMDDFTFAAMYESFDSGYKYPQYALGNAHDLYEIQGLSLRPGKSMYLYRRRHKEKIIVRLGMIYITAGEI
jgi:hypothetical protein